jgi:signal transduction histidine kinase
VQGLAVAQGGRAWAESERDHGTSIFVTLPLAGPGSDGAGEARHATGR